jgi:hypothetical protein
VTAPILLTPQERERFAAWCEQEAASDVSQAEQLTKLVPLAIGQEIARRKVGTAAACRLVASLLRSIESDEVTA